MHRDESPALRGTRLGAVLRRLNPLVRAVLSSPLHWPLSKWFLLLRWDGPRSGKPHAIPVSYVIERGHAYATTGDAWWHNAVAGSNVGVIVHGATFGAAIVPITDARESAAEHELLFRRHPFFRRLAGIPSRPDGSPIPEAVQRSIGAGRTLLRIDLRT